MMGHEKSKQEEKGLHRMHQEECRQYQVPCKSAEAKRQHQEITGINDLLQPEGKMVPERFNRPGIAVFCIDHKILDEYPVQGIGHIGQRGVKMLEAVEPMPVAPRFHPDQAGDLQVRIILLYIGRIVMGMDMPVSPGFRMCAHEGI